MTDARFDSDGRLRVASAPISAVGVGRYNGARIYQDPDRSYRLVRPAEELRRAARSFAGAPLLSRHVEQDEDFTDAVAGAVGTVVVFDAGVLRAPLCIWSGDSVQAVLDGTRAALSAGYSFDVIMKPGTYQGEEYDGRMVDIRGHHVALVGRSNAGPQCRIVVDFEFAA
jgi:hypothetical protein